MSKYQNSIAKSHIFKIKKKGNLVQNHEGISQYNGNWAKIRGFLKVTEIFVNMKSISVESLNYRQNHRDKIFFKDIFVKTTEIFFKITDIGHHI